MHGSVAPPSWDLVVLVVAACLFGSGFMSGTETGLMSVSRIRLRFMELRRQHARVTDLQRLLDRVEDPILTCLIGTNLFNVIGSAFVTVVFTARWGERGELMAAAVMSVLIITLAEIVPKVLYREFPERLTLLALPGLRAAMALLAPVRWILLAYSRLLQRLMPGKAAGESRALDRDAMTSLLTAHPMAVHDRRFTDILDRCLALADLDLTAIMTPWSRVEKLSHDASLGHCRAVAARSGFSRLPVVAGDASDVLGWVLVRDLLFVDPTADWDGIPPTLIRTCPYVDRIISPWALFEEMRWQQQQMAVVTDAAGNPIGQVTLEDLLEVLVGSIEDEFDRLPLAPERSAG
jgi:putative hemolysin